MKTYLKNCFILILPVLLWNVVFARFLPHGFTPEVFWNNIPGYIRIPENIFRLVVMILPWNMMLEVKTSSQHAGLRLYLIGVIVYVLTWVVLMVYPMSGWSQSVYGFAAPAYSPFLWLIGIGLIGQRSFVQIKHISSVYIAAAAFFIFFHTWHTVLVYQRL